MYEGMAAVCTVGVGEIENFDVNTVPSKTLVAITSIWLSTVTLYAVNIDVTLFAE